MTKIVRGRVDYIIISILIYIMYIILYIIIKNPFCIMANVYSLLKGRTALAELKIIIS